MNSFLEWLFMNMDPNGKPAHKRLFLEGVQGKKDPITNKDFSPEEIEFMKELILQSLDRKRNGDKRQGVQWKDYYDIASKRAKQGKPVWDQSASLLGGILGSDPYSRTQLSLGRFNYQLFDDGTALITDKYDFNPINEVGIPGIRAEGVGPADIGRKKLPPGKGRDIYISLEDLYKK